MEIIIKEGDRERRRRLEHEHKAHDTSEAADHAYHNWRNGNERGEIIPLQVTDPKENRRVEDEVRERAGLDPSAFGDRRG